MIEKKILKPSEWVERHLYIEGRPFRFRSLQGPRNHLPYIYDCPKDFVLLKTARGCEKSTTVCNKLVIKCATTPSYKALYVNPSPQQIGDFNIQQLSPRLRSPWIRSNLYDKTCIDNVMLKSLTNGSLVFLRPVLLTPDRVRGIRAYTVVIDEIQDMLFKNVPVIEETLFSSHNIKKEKMYAGTPKTYDNTIQYLWDKSSQNMWHVPCRACGYLDNVLDHPKYIGKNGPICFKCGKRIIPHKGFWVSHNRGSYIEGFHFNQIMLPWSYDNQTSWRGIINKMENDGIQLFMNEVLGVSYDNADKPITEQEMRACMQGDFFPHPMDFHLHVPMFMGVDWGCHDDKTRVLTSHGFKYFNDLAGDDLVAQWNENTKVMTYVKPLYTTKRLWNGSLLKIKNQGVDLLVTGTHRMRFSVGGGETWRTDSAENMARYRSQLKFVGNVDWEGDGVEEFILPGIDRSAGYHGSEIKKISMNLWLEFIGYIISEGGVCLKKNGAPNCIKMSQRETVNPKNTEKIRKCIMAVWGNYSEFPNPKTGDINWTLYGKQLWSWVDRNIGRKCCEKRIPREFLGLPKRQLKILFDALMLGDGSVDKRSGNYNGCYISTSKGLCEDFQELCIKLGLRCKVSLRRKAGGNRKDLWVASWSRGRDFIVDTPKDLEHVPYDGYVYCCGVPDGYIVTERNGCISYHGNTGSSSKTVIVLGYLYEGKVNIPFFMEFPTHIYPTQEAIVDEILKIAKEWRVKRIASDWGFGFANNQRIRAYLEDDMLYEFYNSGGLKTDVLWNATEEKYIINYVKTMSSMFAEFKAGKFVIPKSNETSQLISHFMNVHVEYSERTRKMIYANAPEKPDDYCHATNYMRTMMKIYYDEINVSFGR